MSAPSPRSLSKSLFAWEFTFTDLSTGLSVSAGVFATEFGKARAKALAQLVAKAGGDSGRFSYASYRRLN